MSRRRWLLGLTVTAAVAVAAGGLALLVEVGRSEERRAAEETAREMEALFALVDEDVASRRLTGYRLGPPICFSYLIGKDPWAIQLCFDGEGRLVETVDRRGQEDEYASLAYKPELSPIKVSPEEIAAVLRRIEELRS